MRTWLERQEALRGKTDFTLASAFDDGWRYRPNLRATGRDELGGELLLAPWWGTDPLAPQYGAELFVQGGTAWPDGGGERAEWGRASLLLRTALPFTLGDGWRWRAGLEAEAGQAWGDVPPQRRFFLGSSSTLRGYGPSTLVGDAVGRVRAELARVLPVASVTLFADAGWTGAELESLDADDALISVGLGVSVLDGLVRLDVARGLRAPRDTRVDLYLDSAF